MKQMNEFETEVNALIQTCLVEKYNCKIRDRRKNQKETYLPICDFIIDANEEKQLKIEIEGIERELNSIAFEVQDSGNLKHRLGDIVNAAVYGDLGIVVCKSVNKLRTAKRIYNYLLTNGILRDKWVCVILLEDLKDFLSSITIRSK